MQAFDPHLDLSYQPRKTWPVHDLATFNVFHKTTQLPYQAIFYKGEFVRFAGQHYYVFPHEDVLEQVMPVLSHFGEVEFPSGSRTNHDLTVVHGKKSKISVEANTTRYGGVVRATQVRVNFTWDKFDPGDGKPVDFGGSIVNSLDGTLAFSIMPYSYRQYCENGMVHAESIREISANVIKGIVKEKTPLLEAQIERVQKQTEELSTDFDSLKKLRIIHNKAFPIETIANYLSAVKGSIDSLKERYREMNEMVISKKQAELIGQRMPHKLSDKLEWLKVEEVRDKKTDKLLGHIGKLLEPVKQYAALNDITYELSHNTDRAFLSSQTTYAQVDKILVRSRS
jgi:chaperonin cofactor prefoldin